jgi:ABC-type branched-subunit amino acid transport system substrate-binding protein
MQVRVALVVMAILGTGCGLRVSPARLAAARQGQSVTARGAAASATGGNDTGSAAGPASVLAAGSAAGSAVSGSGSATGTGTGNGPAAVLPPGGNGGATDVGVTATTITLGNVSTLTGPVPGVFEGAVIGTQAGLAYINSLGGIYGRQLKLSVRDDQFDTGQNRAVTLDLLDKVFGFAGSFSSYDDAAVNEIKSSGIVDTSESLTDARRSLANNFSVEPGHKGWRTGPLNYFKNKFPSSVVKTGAIYYDIPSAKASYDGWKAAAQSVGYNLTYERGVQPTETDFTADVVRMRSSGVKQMPYMVSGGLLGLALVVAGGFCYFGYWQTQVVRAVRRDAADVRTMKESLQHIETLLEANVRLAAEHVGHDDVETRAKGSR